MATVFDTAAFILREQGAMTAMKLQKLVYYSQAWHIAWTDDVLFHNRSICKLCCRDGRNGFSAIEGL